MITVQWDSQIEAFTAELQAAVVLGEMEAANVIAQLAKQFVRKDTTSLMETIDIERTAQGVSINAGNVQGGYKGGSGNNDKPPGSPVDYALDQEYHLSGVPSTPFMTPAAEQGFALAQQVIAEEIAKVAGG